MPKTYLAEVAGPLARDVGKRLRAGIELDDGSVSVDSFRVVGRTAGRVMIEVVLHEGRTSSFAGCWMPSDTRSAGWCAPTSDRLPWGTGSGGPDC